MQLRLIASQTDTAERNMALDMALLEDSPTPAFRHYGWSEDAWTFGYTQRYQDILKHADSALKLVRRPTAGGIVDHRNDWTYALTIPSSHQWYYEKAACVYQWVHSNIVKALSLQGTLTTLQDNCSKCSSRCFEGAGVLHDVIFKEKKLAGAAQKRTKQGLLMQGSISKPLLTNIDWELFQKNFVENIAKNMGVEIALQGQMQPSNQWVEKFSSLTWNERR